jgi:hypothetical protein
VQDFQLIDEKLIDQIVYNTPRPTTPLKTFFLPVKENVVKTLPEVPPRIILGIPSCDLAALDMLDAIYLDEPYIDPYYRQKRENTLLIGTDCSSLLDHCHCTVYGIKPYPFKNHDIALSNLDGLTVFMLVIINIIAFVASFYAISYMKRFTAEHNFYALLCLMVGGMNGVVMTGDMFNLFVFLEISVIASYALVAFGTEKHELEASFKYQVSTLITILGTVSMVLGVFLA